MYRLHPLECKVPLSSLDEGKGSRWWGSWPFSVLTCSSFLISQSSAWNRIRSRWAFVKWLGEWVNQRMNEVAQNDEGLVVWFTQKPECYPNFLLLSISLSSFFFNYSMVVPSSLLPESLPKPAAVFSFPQEIRRIDSGIRKTLSTSTALGNLTDLSSKA